LADCCNFHQADSQCRFTLPEKQSARDSKIPVAGIRFKTLAQAACTVLATCKTLQCFDHCCFT